MSASSDGATTRHSLVYWRKIKKKRDFEHVLSKILAQEDDSPLRLALLESHIQDVPSIATLPIEDIENLVFPVIVDGEKGTVSLQPLPVGYKDLIRIFQEYIFEQREFELTSGHFSNPSVSISHLDPLDFDAFRISRYRIRRKLGKLLYQDETLVAIHQRCSASSFTTTRLTNTWKVTMSGKLLHQDKTVVTSPRQHCSASSVIATRPITPRNGNVQESPVLIRISTEIFTTKLSIFPEENLDDGTPRPPLYQNTACVTSVTSATENNPRPNDEKRVVKFWQFPPDQPCTLDSRHSPCNIVSLIFPLLIQWKKKPKEKVINPAGPRPPPLPGETPIGECLTHQTTYSRKPCLLVGLLLRFCVHHQPPRRFSIVKQLLIVPIVPMIGIHSHGESIHNKWGVVK